ncbi:hypothetical protein M0R45_008903 [Rubus argutus]|uniref:Uncharacterized protein n=1 Tax=Rubus argutus TaxID=59490 RepID=A0AAW1Y510_RUBAR
MSNTGCCGDGLGATVAGLQGYRRRRRSLQWWRGVTGCLKKVGDGVVMSRCGDGEGGKCWALGAAAMASTAGQDRRQNSAKGR